MVPRFILIFKPLQDSAAGSHLGDVQERTCLSSVQILMCDAQLYFFDGVSAHPTEIWAPTMMRCTWY